MAVGSTREIHSVDHLIIGAGVAGIVLHRFLKGGRVAIVDPRPGRYKIGESILAEHHADPRLGELLGKAKKLPSFSPKWGSVYVGSDSIASYPLSPADREMAMHIDRQELESLMVRLWETPVRGERVESVSFGPTVVETDTATYRVGGLVFDCSGPAMVLARRLEMRQQLWPTHATWTYYDLDGVDAEAFWRAQEGRNVRRYDAGSGEELHNANSLDRQVENFTCVTQVRDGMWAWQIPMFEHRLLSFGVTWDQRLVSRDELHEIAHTVCEPLYRIRRRSESRHPYDRVHVRKNYACVSDFAASESAVLIGDAAFFGDPIYATGTSVSVVSALEIADIVSNDGWSEDAARRYNQQYRALAENAAVAHFLDPDQPDTEALSKRIALIQGTSFQKQMTARYGFMLARTKSWLGAERQSDPFGSPFSQLDGQSDELTKCLTDLLDLKNEPRLENWRLEVAYATDAGIAMRWCRSKASEVLTVLIQPIDDTTATTEKRRPYRSIGNLGIFYRGAFDRDEEPPDNWSQLLDEIAKRGGGSEKELQRLLEQAAVPIGLSPESSSDWLNAIVRQRPHAKP